MLHAILQLIALLLLIVFVFLYGSMLNNIIRVQGHYWTIPIFIGGGVAALYWMCEPDEREDMHKAWHWLLSLLGLR